MTSPISSYVQDYAYLPPYGGQPRLAPPQNLPAPPPPPYAAGFASAMADSTKVDRLGDLLGMDSGAVTEQATTASDLVRLLQNRGIDLGQLRGVLSNGDLLDVRA